MKWKFNLWTHNSPNQTALFIIDVVLASYIPDLIKLIVPKRKIQLAEQYRFNIQSGRNPEVADATIPPKVETHCHRDFVNR